MADDLDALLARADAYAKDFWRSQMVDDLAAALRESQAATDTIRRLDAYSLARMFHEAYERLAPEFNYKTRKASAVPWDDVPEHNKALMIATARAVLDLLVDGGGDG